MNKNNLNSNLNKNKSEKKKSLADKVGGALEKVGHKISNAGAPKVGQAIHDLGDKLEKSHTNPYHPHKVS